MKIFIALVTIFVSLGANAAQSWQTIAIGDGSDSKDIRNVKAGVLKMPQALDCDYRVQVSQRNNQPSEVYAVNSVTGSNIVVQQLKLNPPAQTTSPGFEDFKKSFAHELQIVFYHNGDSVTAFKVHSHVVDTDQKVIAETSPGNTDNIFVLQQRCQKAGWF